MPRQTPSQVFITQGRRLPPQAAGRIYQEVFGLARQFTPTVPGAYFEQTRVPPTLCVPLFLLAGLGWSGLVWANPFRYEKDTVRGRRSPDKKERNRRVRGICIEQEKTVDTLGHCPTQSP